MATDCEQLSPNARKIFEKLVLHFGVAGLDPWKKPLWTAEGQIRDNWLYDLRKHADRQKMIDRYKQLIGSSVYTTANSYQKKHGSLERFDREHFSLDIQKWAELLILLYDLDFQIETMDIVEG